MDGRKAAALGVCAAASAAATAALLITSRAPKTNVFTITRLDFEQLLENAAGEEWFPANIRCSKSSFLALVSLLQTRGFEFGNVTVREHSYAKRVAAVLYFLASPGSYRASAAAMGMNESVMFEAVDEMTGFLLGMLNEIVCLPSSLEEWRRIEDEFKCKNGIPGIVGAVDGSLFAIQRPAMFEGFYCRKSYTAVNMQAIVDANLKFMAIDIFPGSWSDKKVWMYAPSSKRMRDQMPIESHLIGDSCASTTIVNQQYLVLALLLIDVSTYLGAQPPG